MRFLINLLTKSLIFVVIAAMSLFYIQDIVNYAFQRIEGTPVEAVVIGKTNNRLKENSVDIWKVTVSIRDIDKKKISAQDFEVNPKAYTKLGVGEKIIVLMPKKLIPLEQTKAVAEVIEYMFRGRPTLKDFFLLEAAYLPLYFSIVFLNAVIVLIYSLFRKRKPIT